MSRRPLRSSILLAGTAFTAVALLATAAPAAEDARLASLRGRHAEMRRSHADALNALAGELESAGAADAAAEARSLAAPSDPRKIVLGKLPAQVRPEPPLGLPAAEREPRTRLRKLCAGYANDLYLLSRQALAAGSVRLAYEFVREAAEQDPDNVSARRVLGYVRDGGDWLTPFELRMRRQRNVWTDRFGWLHEDHVARYEAGERLHKGRWMSVEQEAEIRRDFANAWTVRTEHYLVKTNHSLERGVEIAARLETFHDFFVETFAGFFDRPGDVQNLFRGAGVRRAAERPPYEVHYYATRDEYNRRLKPKIDLIEMTNGLYYTADRVAYFYHDPDRTADDTLYHEATHQLLYESQLRHRDVAAHAHFWIVEGFACYMESFRPGEGAAALGDPGHLRLRAARFRFDEGYYVLLGRFAAMGLQEFQNAPEISKNYSQASGLAHFFVHYDGGRYRDALVEHLSQLYHGPPPGRPAPQNLAELAGVPYQDLDRQYAEYVKTFGAPLAAAAAP